MQAKTFALNILHITVFCFVSMSFVSNCAGDATEKFAGNAKETDSPGHDLGKKIKSREGQRAGLDNPRRLAEIIDAAIQASGDTDSQESSGLNLPVNGIITPKVGLRHDSINGDLRMHSGVDIAVPERTAVYPVAPGQAIYSPNQHGYGNMVIVRHADGMITIYAHHSRNHVRKGDLVDIKTKIALSGSTGRSTGPHLHFEAWQAGRNVTRAFLPNFTGYSITAGSDASLDRTNLRKVIMSDGRKTELKKKADAYRRANWEQLPVKYP
jgi:murein DD-endopeptidase MepM/ murein hydrolase activator NlpD